MDGSMSMDMGMSMDMSHSMSHDIGSSVSHHDIGSSIDHSSTSHDSGTSTHSETSDSSSRHSVSSEHSGHSSPLGSGFRWHNDPDHSDAASAAAADAAYLTQAATGDAAYPGYDRGNGSDSSSRGNSSSFSHVDSLGLRKTDNEKDIDMTHTAQTTESNLGSKTSEQKLRAVLAALRNRTTFSTESGTLNLADLLSWNLSKLAALASTLRSQIADHGRLGAEVGAALPRDQSIRELEKREMLVSIALEHLIAENRRVEEQEALRNRLRDLEEAKRVRERKDIAEKTSEQLTAEIEEIRRSLAE